jgi:hypothetical protein
VDAVGGGIEVFQASCILDRLEGNATNAGLLQGVLDDLADFVKLQKNLVDSPKSWSVAAKSIDPKTFDLSVKNPNGGEEIAHRSPKKIMDEIAALDAESAEVLGKITALL